MTAASEKILLAFPHKTIQPIVRQPSYENISELHLKLNTNTASVHSHRVKILLVLLHLTPGTSVYNTQPDVFFVPPLNPGQKPMIPSISTGYQTTELHR